MTLQTKIKKLLGDNFTDLDNELIDELIFNLKMADDCKKDINARGLILNKDVENTTYDRVNKSVEIYNQSLKNVTNLFIRLGINPQERMKLKFEIKSKMDEFDADFS